MSTHEQSQADVRAQLARLSTRLSSADPAASDADSYVTEVDRTDLPQGSTLALVVEVLDSLDADYAIEGSDVYGRWERGLFHFSELGEGHQSSILQVHGTWEHFLPEDAYVQAAKFCNEWNAANAWPKAYAQVDEDERVVGIFGETTVELAGGASFANVEAIVTTGIGTTLGLFDVAAQTFAADTTVE